MPYNHKEHLQARLRLLESDLKDCTNPKVLARWPNLGSDLLKQELRVRIDEVKRQIEECPNV